MVVFFTNMNHVARMTLRRKEENHNVFVIVSLAKQTILRLSICYQVVFIE